MNSQNNKLEKLTTYELVKRALNIDTFTASDYLVQEGFLKRVDKNKPDSFLCMYHDDNTPSFTRSRDYSTLKCWACDTVVKPLQIYADFLIKEKITGNTLYLPEHQLLSEKNFLRWEAAIFLCHNLGEISEEEKKYQLEQLQVKKQRGQCPNLNFLETDNELTQERGDGDDSLIISRKNAKGENSLEIAKNKVDEFKTLNIGTQEELHVVYSLFRDAVEAVRGFRLFKHHKDLLLTDRRLTEYEIYKNGYFSHPLEHEKSNVMNYLISSLRNSGIDIRVLDRIPGFIFNQNTQMYEIGTDYSDAFFIPLLDLFGNTHRIQVRTNGKTKYMWFTVSSLGHCKTPTSILFPQDKNIMDLASNNMLPNNNLYDCFKKCDYYINNSTYKLWEDEVIVIISEGHFKSYKLANHFNCICISIQGLNTWDCSIISLIKIQNRLKLYNKRISKVIIAFDSDTRVKKGLFKNGAYISELLRNEFDAPENNVDNPDDIRFLQGIECFYLEWDDKLGKGFDDVIHNGYDNDVFKITKDTEYEHKHKTIVSLISKYLRKSINNLTTDDLTTYYNRLSEKSIETLEEHLTREKLVSDIVGLYFGHNIKQINDNEIKKLVYVLSSKQMDELHNIKNAMYSPN